MKSHDYKYHVIVLLCVLQIGLVHCEGHQCGENPMKQVLLVAKRTGRTLSHVLTLLKEIDNPAYDNLSRQFRTYAACVGLVDTGYFRKRAYEFHPQAPPYILRIEPKHTSHKTTYEIPPIIAKKQKDLQAIADQNEALYNQQHPGTSEYYAAKNLIGGKKTSDADLDKKDSRKYNVERLKKWLYGPYRNYMNSYYLRWNLMWPLRNEE